MDDGPAKPYIWEYAKTGRAGCTILPTQHILFPEHRIAPVREWSVFGCALMLDALSRRATGVPSASTPLGVAALGEKMNFQNDSCLKFYGPQVLRSHVISSTKVRSLSRIVSPFGKARGSSHANEDEVNPRRRTKSPFSVVPAVHRRDPLPLS